MYCARHGAPGVSRLGEGQISKMNKRRGTTTAKGRLKDWAEHKTFTLESLLYFQLRRLERCRLITDSKAPSPATETQPRLFVPVLLPLLRPTFRCLRNEIDHPAASSVDDGIVSR